MKEAVAWPGREAVAWCSSTAGPWQAWVRGFHGFGAEAEGYKAVRVALSLCTGIHVMAPVPLVFQAPLDVQGYAICEQLTL